MSTTTIAPTASSRLEHGSNPAKIRRSKLESRKYKKGQRIIAYIGGEWHSGIILSANKRYGFTRCGDKWGYAILLDRAFSLVSSLPKRDEFPSVAESDIRVVEKGGN